MLVQSKTIEPRRLAFLLHLALVQLYGAVQNIACHCEGLFRSIANIPDSSEKIECKILLRFDFSYHFSLLKKIRRDVHRVISTRLSMLEPLLKGEQGRII